jgi:hypothetical protein
MKFIEWIRPAFEGIDGKASHKRLTVFALVSTIILMAVCSLFGIKIDHMVLHSLEILAGAIIGGTVYQSVKNEKNSQNT